MSAQQKPLVAEETMQPRSRSGWSDVIRPDVLVRLSAIYGHTPKTGVSLRTEVLSEHTMAGEKSLLRQTAVTVVGPEGEFSFTVAAIVPLEQVPRGTLLGFNFQGNHTVSFDDRMILCDGSDPRTGTLYYENTDLQPAAERGSLVHRWPLDLIVDQGFAVVTACYLQFGPESRGIFEVGPHAILGGTTQRDTDTWGSIGIWAWSLSRVLDLLEDSRLMSSPSGPVYAFGHSRLGKTALWAAAQDPRFAGAIANESGAMGAALTRPVGETPLVLAQVFPYWFSPGFSETAIAGTPLAVDQDRLLACIAPRVLLVGSAADDLHADPEGEYLATQRASAVWDLYGEPERVHHHLRQGGHEFLREDWELYLRHLSRFDHRQQ